ncbi:MAG: hypothetical protein NT105_11800 [Verrucomicrobia bacterium]|nr:hypothetical protein [Verrucomicrobiota bacterium]
MNTSISRQAVIPITLTITGVSILLAFITYFVGVADYHHYHHLSTQARVPLPAFSAAFESVLPWAWGLPLVAGGFGFALARRTECRVSTLAWYCCGLTILASGWAASTFLALHLMYVCFHHII